MYKHYVGRRFLLYNLYTEYQLDITNYITLEKSETLNCGEKFK